MDSFVPDRRGYVLEETLREGDRAAVDMPRAEAQRRFESQFGLVVVAHGDPCVENATACHLFPHPALAAFLALARRCAGVIAAARACPPFEAPFRASPRISSRKAS